MATADPQPPPTHPIPPQALQGPTPLTDALTPQEWETELNAEMEAAAAVTGVQDIGAAVIAVIRRLMGGGGGDVAPGRQGQWGRPGGGGGSAGGGASGGGMVAA